MKLYFLPPLVLQKLIWVPTRIILSFFGHLYVNGLHNMKDIKGNIIFACNHTSELDPILIPASLPFWSRFSPIFYTSREESFYKNSGWRQNLYGGLFFKAWGAYPVSTGLRNYEKSLKNHIEIARDGGSICVFPEGRITPTGTIQPAKGGVAYLSHITKTVIVPVAFKGTYHLSLGNFFRRNGNISVTFGKPLNVMIEPNTTLCIADFKDYANFTMDKVKDLLLS